MTVYKRTLSTTHTKYRILNTMHPWDLL